MPVAAAATRSTVHLLSDAIAKRSDEGRCGGPRWRPHHTRRPRPRRAAITATRAEGQSAETGDADAAAVGKIMLLQHCNYAAGKGRRLISH